MTIPSERYRSLERVPEELLRLLQAGRVRKGELREIVGRVLRHYPTRHELERMRVMCKGILRDG